MKEIVNGRLVVRRCGGPLGERHIAAQNLELLDEHGRLRVKVPELPGHKNTSQPKVHQVTYARKKTYSAVNAVASDIARRSHSFQSLPKVMDSRPVVINAVNLIGDCLYAIRPIEAFVRHRRKVERVDGARWAQWGDVTVVWPTNLGGEAGRRQLRPLARGTYVDGPFENANYIRLDVGTAFHSGRFISDSYARQLGVAWDGDKSIPCSWLSQSSVIKRNVIAIAPYATDPNRSFSRGECEQIISKIRAVGAQAEFVSHLEQYPELGVSTFRATTLDEFVAYARSLRSLVSCETGIAHLASMLGISTDVVWKAGLKHFISPSWAANTRVHDSVNAVAIPLSYTSRRPAIQHDSVDADITNSLVDTYDVVAGTFSTLFAESKDSYSTESIVVPCASDPFLFMHAAIEMCRHDSTKALALFYSKDGGTARLAAIQQQEGKAIMAWVNPHLREPESALPQSIVEIITPTAAHIPGKPTVAILLNTIDRYDLTVRCIGGALATAGYPFEFLVCDNGSQDRRVIDYIAKFAPVYFRQNPGNEGCAQMHNQMLLRTKADLFCLLDNDIEIKLQDWLRILVETYTDVPNSGMAGVYTMGLGCANHPGSLANNREVHIANPPMEDAVFGTRLFGRAVLEKVGFFCEDYSVYGLCDNEYNTRVHHSGFVNYYVGGPTSEHLGADSGDTSQYRRMKDASMNIAKSRFVENTKRYFATRNFFVAAPEMR